MPGSDLPLRPTSRIVLLDPADRVLMLRIHDPAAVNGRNALPTPDFWVLIGGGVEAGEDHLTAIRREVLEEAGIDDFTLGPEIWQRERVINLFGEDALFQERYYAGRVTTPATSMANLTPLETEVVREQRWLPREEIAASGELFLPPPLLDLIDRAIAAQPA